MDEQTLMLIDIGGNNSATPSALVKPHGLTINPSSGRVEVSCPSYGTNRKNIFTQFPPRHDVAEIEVWGEEL